MNGSLAQERLEAIHVRFLTGRPPGRIRLAVQCADGQHFEQVYEEGNDVCWKGIRMISLSTTIWIEVAVWKPRCRQYEPVGMAQVQSRAEHIQCVSVQDPQGRLELSLAFRMSTCGIICNSQATSSYPASDGYRSALHASVQTSRTEGRDRTTVSERLGKACWIISFLKTMGETTKDIHPVIARAMAAFNKLSDACEKSEGCRDSATEVLVELEIFVEIGGRIPELESHRVLIPLIERMLELLEDVMTYIFLCTLAQASSGILAPEYEVKMSGFRSSFSMAARDFHRSLADSAGLVQNMESPYRKQDRELRQLEALHPSSGASHQANPRDICLGTRTSLLNNLMDWLRSSDGHPSQWGTPIIWLHGIAGSGKSTVAKTFARMASRKGYSVLCFFCRRDHPDLSNPRRVFSTLSYLLAQHHLGYRRAILRLLVDPMHADIGSDTAFEQYTLLFRGLLDSLVDPGQPFVVVVEAVDECGSQQDQEQLANHLVDLAGLVSWMKVLVTSRTDPRVKRVFDSRGARCKAINIMEDPHTDADVRQYIDYRLSTLSPPIPSSPDIADALVMNSAGLFVWCNALFDHLQDSLDPEGALSQLLSNTTQIALRRSGAYKTLYELYDLILDSSIRNEEDKPIVKDILGLVLVSSDTCALSCDAMAAFLKCRVELVHGTVQALHSVLYEDNPIPGRKHGSIRAHHKSFRDYIWSNMEDEASSGWKPLSELQLLVGQRSLDVMLEQLKFNMCNLRGPPILNKDIPDLRLVISTNVTAELEYASLFWAYHLSASALGGRLPQFERDGIQKKVASVVGGVKAVFYLEVLSLLDASARGVEIFSQSGDLFRDCTDISEPAMDIKKLLSSFAGAMQSAPHIYLSLLSWLPSHSYIHRTLGPLFDHCSLILSERDDDWDASIATTNVGRGVLAIAYSPDGARIACGLRGGAIRILDARTGTVVYDSIQGHSDSVRSIAYSADGLRIVSGSKDCTLRLWDAYSGNPIGEPLRGHSLAVCSVAFSPDCASVASGSSDGTVRLWDARSGAPRCEALRGHSYGVLSVAYSPDNIYLASGSKDGTIRIWNAETGDAVGKPLRGHTSAVYSIAYSPNGAYLVSGSDDHTLRIWSSRTGTSFGEPLRAHFDSVFSVTFSPDGKHIASGSRDATVRIWDAQTRMPSLAPFLGHSNSVYAVAFSPDGAHLASGSHDNTVHVWSLQNTATTCNTSQGHLASICAVAHAPDRSHIVTASADRTVRLWDAQTGISIGDPLPVHSNDIRSVAYAPDSARIATGSSDSTIRLWDVLTGAVLGVLHGHTNAVLSIAFSPDGTQLASASDDHTIRLWAIHPRVMIGEPLQGHAGAVHSVAYSPDGQQLATGSADCTVRVWDPHTGGRIGGALRGHRKAVNCVAYSPNSRHIVSGSSDCTLRVWDAQTGVLVGEPLRGHSDAIHSVAYSPTGNYIVSGSSDNTVRIWDAHSLSPVGEPLRGHSNAVNSVAYTPDGLRIISVSSDQTIRIWDVATPADEDWHKCCSSMDPADGWVREGNSLLLWVPFKYRDRLRHRSSRVIGQSIRRNTPVVNVQRVRTYASGQWVTVLEDECAPYV